MLRNLNGTCAAMQRRLGSSNGKPCGAANRFLNPAGLPGGSFGFTLRSIGSTPSKPAELRAWALVGTSSEKPNKPRGESLGIWPYRTIDCTGDLGDVGSEFRIYSSVPVILNVRHLSLMTQITYRNWILDCDVEATRAGYETVSAGGAETCGCAGCRNFLVQRDSVYLGEILNLFNELGVNYKRDAETCHTSRLEPGLHLYGSWFHFVGAIVKKPIGPATLNHLTIDFIPHNALAAKAFENQRLVQIEITVKLPWVLTEPELS